MAVTVLGRVLPIVAVSIAFFALVVAGLSALYTRRSLRLNELNTSTVSAKQVTIKTDFTPDPHFFPFDTEQKSFRVVISNPGDDAIVIGALTATYKDSDWIGATPPPRLTLNGLTRTVLMLSCSA